jgi:hypothetical protein
LETQEYIYQARHSLYLENHELQDYFVTSNKFLDEFQKIKVQMELVKSTIE